MRLYGLLLMPIALNNISELIVGRSILRRKGKLKFGMEMNRINFLVDGIRVEIWDDGKSNPKNQIEYYVKRVSHVDN